MPAWKGDQAKIRPKPATQKVPAETSLDGGRSAGVIIRSHHGEGSSGLLQEAHQAQLSEVLP